MQNIGFIGLGIMGKPMAKNLLKAGKSLVVYDIVPTAVEELVGAGGTLEPQHAARARGIAVAAGEPAAGILSPHLAAGEVDRGGARRGRNGGGCCCGHWRCRVLGAV